jgi:hypothetical protein
MLRAFNAMSGHYPFRELVKDFSSVRIEAVRKKKHELTQLELHRELFIQTVDEQQSEFQLTCDRPNDQSYTEQFLDQQ